MSIRIWQEYDCPECLIDFDLTGDEILAVGEECFCSGCGGWHKAGPQDVISETYILGADDQMQVRGLPVDAAEKVAWIAEADSMGRVWEEAVPSQR